MASPCIVGVYIYFTWRQTDVSGHWGLSSPRDGVVRFTEHNDLIKFYEVAKEVGILVIVCDL